MTTLTITGTPAALFSSIRSTLLELEAEALAEAKTIMQESVEAGQAIARDRIEAAITPTGIERAKSGGHPGRIETEAFWNEFEATSEHEGDRITGRLGWEDGGRETYFAYQEQGTATIEEVHALTDAERVAMDEFRSRLTAWVEERHG